jgi:hypothetical protein
MSELVKARPDKPIEFLASYLLQHDPQRVAISSSSSLSLSSTSASAAGATTTTTTTTATAAPHG